MGKYRISWAEELWYRMDVDADSVDDARDKFHAGEYDFDRLAKNTNVEMRGSVVITEVSRCFVQ